MRADIVPGAVFPDYEPSVRKTQAQALAEKH
jgi:hypothetical protein